MTVTFIYKINNDNTVYFGKYIGYITDDYDNSLDYEIKSMIYPILKTKYNNLQKSDLHTGILFHKKQEFDYYSENEKYAFNLWCCETNYDQKKIFLDNIEIDYNTINFNDYYYENNELDEYNVTKYNDNVTTDEESNITEEESNITEEESNITDEESNITDEESNITDEESNITDEESNITDEDNVPKYDDNITSDEESNKTYDEDPIIQIIDVD